MYYILRALFLICAATALFTIPATLMAMLTEPADISFTLLVIGVCLTYVAVQLSLLSAQARLSSINDEFYAMRHAVAQHNGIGNNRAVR